MQRCTKHAAGKKMRTQRRENNSNTWRNVYVCNPAADFQWHTVRELDYRFSLPLVEDGWGIIPLGRYYGLLSILFLLQLQTARDTREPIAFTACPIHHLFSSSARPAAFSFVWVRAALVRERVYLYTVDSVWNIRVIMQAEEMRGRKRI